MIKVLRNKTTIARKEHRCEFCGEVIHVGEKYYRQTNVYDGCIYDWVCHCDCLQLACELDMFDDCDEGLDGDGFINSLNQYVHDRTEMNKTQKKLLARLMAVTNSLGGTLDGTATCEQKYIDRQRAHRLSYKVIYGLFGDNPNNPYREDDINNAYKAIEEMEKLIQKVYPDRSGFLKNEEKQ